MNAARNLQRRVERMDKVERPVLERRRDRAGAAIRTSAAESASAELRKGGDGLRRATACWTASSLTVMHGERVGVVGRERRGQERDAQDVLVGELDANRRRGAGSALPSGSATWRRTRTPWTLIPRRWPPCAPASPGTEEQAVGTADDLPVRLRAGPGCPIRTLSGGERTRLQPMPLMLSGANLPGPGRADQPPGYRVDRDPGGGNRGVRGDGDLHGHDRYFLDRMADRVVEVRDGAARSWIGGYSDWLVRRSEAATPLAAGGSIRE